MSGYIKEKLEQKQKIDQHINEANDVLQSKNVSIQAINEHIKLNEELNKHGLASSDVDKLLNLLLTAKEYGFDSKKIMSKLRSMKRLERREKGLRGNCVILSMQIAKYKDIMPLTEEIVALGIGIDELIALKAGINQAVKHYNLPPLAATLRLIDDIKNYNKIGGLKKQLSELYLHKFAINEACLHKSQALVNLAGDKIESFIANISSSNLPPEKVIELVNELFNVSKAESIPLDQVSSYIKEKLQEKQKIDDEIKQADVILEDKNVSIEAINEHIQLNEEPNKYRLSTKDIHRLLDLLLAANEYRYSPGKIVAKLRSIKRLENKEKRLKNSFEILSKKEAKYKELIPLANIIWDLHIGRSELISFKIAVNETAETYGFPASTAAFHVLNNIKDYNKIGGLKKELNKLTTQVVSVNEICFHQNKSMMAMLNLQSRGITEEQIISLSNILRS